MLMGKSLYRCWYFFSTQLFVAVMSFKFFMTRPDVETALRQKLSAGYVTITRERFSMQFSVGFKLVRLTSLLIGLFLVYDSQKPIETAQEVLERAAKKGLMKPKTKTTRVSSPREKPRPARAQADISRLRIKETPSGNLSDNEGDRNSLKVTEKRKPRSWHGSAEDIAKPSTKDVASSIPKPSESEQKKSGKKMSQPRAFMF